MTKQNFQPPWDFAGPEIPKEWFIHAISIKRPPAGKAGEDDAGGRVFASSPQATTLFDSIRVLVELRNADPMGPEDANVRLVIKNRYVIWTYVDLTTVRRGDLVIWNGRNLTVLTQQDVEGQNLLWRLQTAEYA